MEKYDFHGFGENQSMRNYVASNIGELMKTDPNIIVLGADLNTSLGIYNLEGEFGRYNEYPHGRVINCGISEQAMMGMAGGLAQEGYEPWVGTFVLFALRGMEPFYQAVALPDNNVKLWLSHYGLGIGQDGPTAQSIMDKGIWRSIPNVRSVITPADAIEAVSASTHMHENDGIYVLRLSRNSTPLIFDGDYNFSESQAMQLFDRDAGSKGKITIISDGEMTHQVLRAVVPELKEVDWTLTEKGYGVRVVHMPSLHVDEKMVLEAYDDSDLLVTVEDHHINGGLGSEVAEVMAENGCSKKLHRIGLTSFGESGPPAHLYKKYGLDAEGITRKIEELY